MWKVILLLISHAIFYNPLSLGYPVSNGVSESKNKQLIENFYTAFQTKDAAGMVACYHKDVIFIDPAFDTLQGDRAKAMWEMLLSSDSEMDIEYSNIEDTDSGAQANWEAFYIFGEKKRPVHNIVFAKFKFKDGLIIEHIDKFNLKKWASQALGFGGKLFGGTKFFKKKLNQQTNKMLDEYIESQKNRLCIASFSIFRLL